jgi:hypothetical protein
MVEIAVPKFSWEAVRQKFLGNNGSAFFFGGGGTMVQLYLFRKDTSRKIRLS